MVGQVLGAWLDIRRPCISTKFVECELILVSEPDPSPCEGSGSETKLISLQCNSDELLAMISSMQLSISQPVFKFLNC